MIRFMTAHAFATTNNVNKSFEKLQKLNKKNRTRQKSNRKQGTRKSNFMVSTSQHNGNHLGFNNSRMQNDCFKIFQPRADQLHLT